jgi:hypothetical protein
MGLVLVVFSTLVGDTRTLSVLVGVPLGLGVYVAVAWALRVEQLRSAVRLVARRLG